MKAKKKLHIHGIRGIPAAHGGFETFVQYLAPYLVEHDWDVTVYCQESGTGDWYTDTWNGIRLIHIPVESDGAKGSIKFDWLTIKDAVQKDGINLTLGYNTAIFWFLFRLKGKTNLANMDGIEWKRQKWSKLIQAWFYINERLGCWFGTHLIADHPEICNHLKKRVNQGKITTIPYGADSLEQADLNILKQFDIEANKFSLVIARPEPENSIREIIAAYSKTTRGEPLVVLGNYNPDENPYHKEILDIASDEVKFVGAIYDLNVVNALRFYTRVYIHGHQVGGTNPSLVEALGAGSPVLAHDNRFNRWVAGDIAHYFKDENSCADGLDVLFGNGSSLEEIRKASRARHQDEFTWEKVLSAYETLLSEWYDSNK